GHGRLGTEALNRTRRLGINRTDTIPGPKLAGSCRAYILNHSYRLQGRGGSFGGGFRRK
ncbi:hypothetical protein SK128_019547, partial [Halocaridina rubra]